MRPPTQLPARADYVIVGAGFAGAATAWALGRRGPCTGVILDRELTFGVHASGRNAAMSRLTDEDPLITALAWRSTAHIRALEETPGELLRPTGGLTLAPASHPEDLEAAFAVLRAQNILCELLRAPVARARFPFLDAWTFDLALWSPEEGIVDIHALLSRYLKLARQTGFTLVTNCLAEGLIIEDGRVAGVRTSQGEIRTDTVIDASGAWAGQLGREAQPLPLEPRRRHLFVSGPLDHARSTDPFVWLQSPGFYFRAEGDGLLLSPCDETANPPGLPATDAAATELLAEKLSALAPTLADISIRRQWACLRTFTPDRRPLIGPDPTHPGLFHVSGLGGFGMTTSAAIGELAADLLHNQTPTWLDPKPLAPGRFQLI